VPAIFQPRIAEKINKAPSVSVIVICSDRELLWQDSYKGVGRVPTLPESILHKIIIIIIIIIIIVKQHQSFFPVFLKYQVKI